MKFPKHKSGLYLTHNEHKTCYQNVENFLRDRKDIFYDNAFSWACTSSRQKCIETNELWELLWYPDTPVSYICILGSSLEEILDSLGQKEDV